MKTRSSAVRLLDTISGMRTIGCHLLVGVLVFAQASRPVEEFKTKAGVVKITPIRHASMMIEAGGKVIHVDPWSRGILMGWRRRI